MNPLIRKYALPIVIALGLAGGGAYAYNQLTTPNTAIVQPTANIGIEIGDLAPEINTTDLDNNPVSLSDYHGDLTIVNFWATWCGPCRIEMPELQKAYESGFNVVAINMQEKPDTISSYQSELSLNFPIWLDTNAKARQDYRIRGLPTTYFISPEGKVLNMKWGPFAYGELEQKINELEY